jgi:hypothetical protein
MNHVRIDVQKQVHTDLNLECWAVYISTHTTVNIKCCGKTPLNADVYFLHWS